MVPFSGSNRDCFRLSIPKGETQENGSVWYGATVLLPNTHLAESQAFTISRTCSLCYKELPKPWDAPRSATCVSKHEDEKAVGKIVRSSSLGASWGRDCVREPSASRIQGDRHRKQCDEAAGKDTAENSHAPCYPWLGSPNWPSSYVSPGTRL